MEGPKDWVSHRNTNLCLCLEVEESLSTECDMSKGEGGKVMVLWNHIKFLIPVALRIPKCLFGPASG
ncbi:hypothetical protein AV530_004059 [Patagioenas fasciata monilis]|uniref:Uncharacterized protein n=1 Tax=Patagioenas fasciata monilis TaxID=372326 RepID=A0A1V4JTQ0_PATFA|nr:hypothetical protein AV530_004059 [Patagioenas fasciata monilis]